MYAPINVAWEYDKCRSLEEKRARLGLVECVNHGHLQPYPVLYEKPGKDDKKFFAPLNPL